MNKIFFENYFRKIIILKNYVCISKVLFFQQSEKNYLFVVTILFFIRRKMFHKKNADKKNW